MLLQYLKYLLCIVFAYLATMPSFSQCNLLTGNRNINYVVDGQCAPTTVTQFTIEYEFLTPQIPADLSIIFEWNDPDANVDVYTIGDPEFVISAAATRFQATGTFSYPVNDECAFFPTAFLLINGTPCVSSQEEKTAISWDADDGFGGILAITPPIYEVCFGDAIIGAQFVDNSTFNCNMNDEPDNPNQIERHVQFVYGNVATHDAANTILDLSLNDGGNQPLTDGLGAISAPIGPRGTGATQITAAYFGPVENVPFPANLPNAASFLMNAPANAANAIGNTFEVTMYNWNICNPYNGDALNPNYDDAISTTANITIIAAPIPNFVTREAGPGGLNTTDFCIGEVVYFDNQTAGGGLNFLWEYFDGPLDTDPLLGSSTAANATNIFNTGGQKLIRLTATNPTAQSACQNSIDLIITITSMLVADIRITDLSDVDMLPYFCQDAAISQSFDVRFHDVSIGVATANTERRWEFYDQTGVLASSVGFIAGVASLNPPDQSYTTPGNYEVKLITRDNITGCETEDSDFVRIYADPVANFTATEICEGMVTHFENTSSVLAINGESIVNVEWDFSYDGSTFVKDAAFDGMTSFDHNLGGANTYNVAIRVVTDQNSCENILAQPVIVRPLPISSFTIDQTSACSVLPIQFTNTGHASQPADIQSYVWQIDYNDGNGFVDYETQDPSSSSFNTVFIRNFTNNSLIDLDIDIRLKTENVFGCEVTSPVQSATIFPAPQSGFGSLNYNPFANNCGSLSVDFQVDDVTQTLGPTNYVWRVTDANGVQLQPDEVNVPPVDTFNFTFINTSTTLVQDFNVHLTTNFEGGCPSDSIRTIRVNPIPTATFVIDTLDIGCESISLQAETSQKGLNEYAWEVIINGGTILSTTAVGDLLIQDFSRPAAGLADLNVDIRLQTTNFASCQSIVEQMSVVVPAQDNINAGFVVNPLTQTFPDNTVTITNTTNSGSWNYSWDFGDGQSSSDPNILTHTYDAFGNYTITLTVSSANCTEVASQTISIDPAIPLLDFEYLTDAGCAPLIVQFTNQSQYADPASYEWDFGDGETLVGVVDPIHVYTESGTYSVKLTANNGQGDESVILMEGIIEVYNPSAPFSSNDPMTDLCGDATVNFEVDPDIDGFSRLLQFSWEVYDEFGAILSSVNNLPSDPNFSFHFVDSSTVETRTFDVKLTTNFIDGCSSDSTRSIQINPIPSALFKIDTLMISCDEMELHMEAVQKDLTQYDWDIVINGTTVFSSNTIGDRFDRTFNRPPAGDGGSAVEISLQTVNFANCQSPIKHQNLVVLPEESIEASFIITPLIQTLPDRVVNIVNTTNTGNWTCLWDFGDGQTSTDPNVSSHEYSTYGDYLVTLTVSSEYCIEMASQMITIHPIPPIVDFEYTPQEGCTPLTVDFTNLTQFAEVGSYLWNFGDGGGISQATNPRYTYVNPGVYTVSLQASNGLGDEVIEIKENIIEVFQTPVAIFNMRPEIVYVPNPVYTNNNSFGATSFIWDFGDGSTSTEFEPIHEYTEINKDSFDEEVAYDVSLIAINENGCTDTTLVSNAVIAKKRGGLLIPNAFSPNLNGPSSGGVNDSGSNDIFLPITENVTSFQMQIFNKWGEMLFETSNKQHGWDGYYKGRLVPQDVYVYRLSLEFDNGSKETRIGDVTLIR